MTKYDVHEKYIFTCNHALKTQVLYCLISMLLFLTNFMTLRVCFIVTFIIFTLCCLYFMLYLCMFMYVYVCLCICVSICMLYLYMLCLVEQRFEFSIALSLSCLLRSKKKIS